VYFNLADVYPVPVKYEHVVFCNLSEFQLKLYRLFIVAPEIKALLRGTESQPLKAINILKKLCNHPELLNLPEDLKGSESLIPEGFCGPDQAASGRSRDRSSAPVHCEWSGKFIVLERFVTLELLTYLTNDTL
jgi:DNA repair and recombination RAD54-like protein